VAAPDDGSLERVDELRVPDFFIVGSPKTGTTSLFEMLRQHPGVFMPDLKEPLYLAADARVRPGHEREPREHGLPVTLEEYLALFAPAGPGQLIGEASTFYLWSSLAAQEIAALQPRARAIAVLREPASFLRSLHMMFQRWGLETEKRLERATSPELEAERRAGRKLPRTAHRPQLLQYAEHVRYAEQVQRYHAALGTDRTLVLIHDDYRADTAGTIQSVLRFLELDEDQQIEPVTVNVTSRTVRSPRLKRMLTHAARGEGPLARSSRAAVKALTPAGLRRDAVRKLRRHAVTAEPKPVDDAYMTELRRRYKPEVERLSELLGRDLVGEWGYDRLG
jgi:hypothetical protein